jgi:hypothetical protein
MSSDGFRFPPKARIEPSVPPLDERMLPAEAATYLGVSAATLRGWRSQKKGPAFYRVNRIFYWRRDLDDWISSRRVSCR